VVQVAERLAELAGGGEDEKGQMVLERQVARKTIGTYRQYLCSAHDKVQVSPERSHLLERVQKALMVAVSCGVY
jgi:hypothetical protein